MSFLWYSNKTLGCPTHQLSLLSNWQDDGFGNCIDTFLHHSSAFSYNYIREDLH